MGVKKTAKRWVSLFLVCILALPLQFMPVKAEETDEVKTYEVTALKSNVTDSTQLNYFEYTAYFGKTWTLNESESYIDLGATDDKAEECYFEIHFRGNAIKVSATKAPAHGKVKYTVDDEHEQIVDLYNDKRQVSVVYEVSGLTEGDHVLKAVTQTDKTGSSIVNQVVSAEITHEPYIGGIPNLGGTIEDTNWQYTQDRYGEIAAEKISTAELSAWKNDKATSEIVLYSKNCTLTNVRMTASALKNADGDTIPAENVKTTFIKSAKAYNGGYLGYGSSDRQIPEETASNRSESSDILYQEGGSMDMAWNSLQPVWVEFNIPKDASAGTYVGTIRAIADGIEKPITFTYRIEVQDAVLPDADTYADTFDIELWQYPYSSAEYYGVEPFSEEHLELMKSIMLKYKEIGGHAITTTISEDAWSAQTYSKKKIHYPSMVKWTKEADGSFTYDYTDFDKWVEFCKSEIRIGDKIVIYSIAPWHNSFTYWENGELVKESFTAGSERYNKVWGDFLKDLIAHLESKGWFEDSYIGIDERNFSAAAFDLIESVTNEDGQCLKTAGAMDHFKNKKNLAMRVTDLNVGDSAAQGDKSDFEQLLKDREAKGLRTTLYSCTEHKPGNFSLSMPAESYWSVINAAKMGTAGFLRWAYDAWVEDPLRDTTHNSFEPGDCFLIFPDEKDAVNKTSKSSIRLERMAEGVRDVNKLMLIEKEAPQLSADIQALYAKIETIAGSVTGGSLLNSTERTKLAKEMVNFKTGISEITNKYLKTKNKPGIYADVSEKTMETGGTFKISADLVGIDDTLIYKSQDTSIASVDAEGLVTARGVGSTFIILKAAEYTTKIKIIVEQRTLPVSNPLTDYQLPEKYLSDVYKGDPDFHREDADNYLGQPDMIMLDDNKTLITVFPVGHGKGRIIMMVSHDAGETWTQKTDIPTSWATSYETPTIYKLNMTDGTTKLILISGRPKGFYAPTGGWDTSISTDGGETWSEFKTYHENLADGRRNETVVAMASLVQLKENGKYIDKWMGVYHDGGSFVNFKTYLTFDEDGNEQWSTPEPYLSEYRQIESSHQICEVGMFRSPDGNRIVALARNQTHGGPATMFYSDDEGETWTKPVAMPGSLAGERHKILYDPTDPTGQRIMVTFREIIYKDNKYDSNWKAGDWIAWVGTYEDIIEGRDGDYRILLCEDWAANPKSGDTGYSGMVVLPDGTFVLDTYGHWDKAYSESFGASYSVYNDMCWIKQAKFKLSNIEESYGEEIAETAAPKLEEEIEKMPAATEESKYTEESWSALQDAYETAMAIKESSDSTSIKYYEAIASLRKAYKALVVKGSDEIADSDGLEDLTKATGISLDQKSIVLQVGGTEKLTALVEPADMASQHVKWQSNNLEVAEVDENGVVTAIGAGKTVITATSSEDETLTVQAEVTVKNIENEDQQALKQALTADAALIKDAGARSRYTETSWKAFLTAYQAAEAGINSEDAAELKRLLQALNAAQKALVEKQFESDGNSYQIIDESEGTVKLVKGADKKKISIDTVSRNGKTYKVVAIASNAFMKCKTLQNVTIGANVTSIEKNAFNNCSKIKKVIFKGAKLPAMKKAFKKTNKKLTVKVQKNLKKKASVKNKTMKTLKKAGLKVTLKNIK